MERSIGCIMAELGSMKGYNCTKTAMSQQRILRKKNVQIPTPPSPRPFNTLQSSLAVPVRIGSKDKERVW